MGARCPFYGFRWPDRKTDLIHVGENECALDLDVNGPCKMEQEGRTVCLDYCDVAACARPFIEAVHDRIRIYPEGVPEGIGYVEWHDRVMRPTGKARHD